VFCDVNGLSSTNQTLKMVIVKGCSMIYHIFKLIDVELDEEEFWISECLLFFHEQLAKRKMCCLNHGIICLVYFQDNLSRSIWRI
jgi:hypothetical protein